MSITTWTVKEKCTRCNGIGFIPGEGSMSHVQCPECNGTGEIRKTHYL